MGDGDDAWNDYLRNPPFYNKGRASPTFNQLLTALWDLRVILTRITKMRIMIFAPEACGRSLEDVFNDDDDASAEISGE